MDVKIVDICCSGNGSKTIKFVLEKKSFVSPFHCMVPTQLALALLAFDYCPLNLELSLIDKP